MVTNGSNFPIAFAERSPRFDVLFPLGGHSMNKLSSVAITVLLASTLSACGTIVGAGVGGAAGHTLSKGSTVGTIGGAALGGAIGSRF